MVSSDEDRAFDYGTTPPAERSALAKQASKPNKAGISLGLQHPAIAESFRKCMQLISAPVDMHMLS